ncbi:acyl-CoA thioesterase [Rubritalea spongiae]|uniref:Acyl-CoA thioesterase n=1 Tax=Rubritalea spongiae TaxID=430797 RepID=A0ABW5DZL6_9BACT
MKFYSRKWVKPEDLNANGTLFGGRLLAWIDEEAVIYAMCQLDSKHLVTRFVSEVSFINAAQHGDVIELGLETVSVGRTSITLKCVARNKVTKQDILTIERLVFVQLDENGQPTAHKLAPEA